MTPLPQEATNHESPPGNKNKPLTGDEIVISGISGLFPKSDNVKEFMDNLYNKVDMVTIDDLNFNHPEAAKHFGKISGMGKFDAQFFRVTHNQAISLEPMSRKLMEHAYTAIFDAGINPLVYMGRKIGVYVGTSYLDSANISLYTGRNQNGFIISGASKCMFANRISYFLNGKAPSIAVDCSCASGLSCLEQAYNDMKSGICEVALVGGCQLCIHPVLALNIKRTGVMCSDGKTKCFDKNADGFVRSDAINVLFLQKAKDAKRIYAEIYFAKSQFGLTDDSKFLPMRKQNNIVNFLESFYTKAHISPEGVEYVEANGAALPEADANELQAIGDFFAKEKSVMVGCVKSNMGNSEPVSGLCGITKLCLAYHKGKLPPNLHYSNPLDISAIKEGKLKVVSDNTPFDRGFTAINLFASSGTDCHVLLKGHYKPKESLRYCSKIPRLIFISGRSEKSIDKIIDILKSQPIDPELIGLLHNIYQVETSGHTFRGFAVLDTNVNSETVALSQSAELYQGIQRPLWLVFSGMGSQWAGMGAKLMRIPIFAAAVEKCRKVLEPKGIDIVRIITDPDPAIFDHILNCFVGIAAVQIGLTDILKEMGVVPDYIIGHSVGELGCAYFDGCFTAEEMILAAYARGSISKETEFIKGSMAAVGLAYQEVLPMLPPEIDIACHNSFESCTITGPTDIVKSFIQELKAKNIFAKEVPSANIAYHSRYIAKAGPSMVKRLNEVIKNPVPRSEKWICTSLPKERWDEPLAKYSSPEFHANNFLNPVYFEEAAKLIPPNAVIVEVAPHGLLQAILKRSHKECIHIPLTRRGHLDPVLFLLESFGKLYREGFNLKPNVLYPNIEYPVSTETPLLSHFVEWYHEENWATALHETKLNVVAPIRNFVMSLQDDDYKFMAGNVEEDKIIFPKAAILRVLWETLAMFKETYFDKLSVSFNDVHFFGDVIIDPEEDFKLEFSINRGNDYFEVTHNNVLIATGYVAEVPKQKNILVNIDATEVKEENMNSDDIYQTFYLKGYQYRGEFQSIICASDKWNTAKIKWTGNWITFLDSLIQLNILARNHDGVSKTTLIKNMTINVVDHLNWINSDDSNNVYFNVQRDEYSDVTRCNGVEIQNIHFQDKLSKEQEPDILQTMTFVPHNITHKVDLKEALQINLQLVADNLIQDNIMVVDLTNLSEFDLLDSIIHVSENIFNVTFSVEKALLENLKSIAKYNLLVVQNIHNTIYNDLCNIIGNETFILSFEEDGCGFEKYRGFNVITSIVLEGQTLVLLKKATNDENVIFIPVTHDSQFSWVSRVQETLQELRKVVLVSENESLSNSFGLVKQLKKDINNQISLIIVDDHQAPLWDPEQKIYKKQINKNLTFNVLKKGQWGSYYNIPCKNYINKQSSFELINTTSGNIDGLKWAETRNEQKSKNVIQVCFAGPSMKDAQKVVGIIESKINGFGMDFSGFDSKGNKVMGLINSGALSSSVEADSDLLWPIPDNWTLEEAATVPLPYVQAMYCLTIKGELRSHQSVFVTCGAGALGQAVISICLAVGCSVYTCVSDIQKKQYLMKLFPKLEEKNIGYNNDGSFHMTVVCNSRNKRCDFVINCMSGPMREFAMKCVGINGIFLDLSVNDINSNKIFGMFYLKEERSYKAVDLNNIFRPENINDKKLLQRNISEGIAKGIIRPISHVTFTTEEVQRAIRLLTLNKNRGRVLINIKDLESSLKNASYSPKITFAANGSYVVVCDETVLGIEIANRLVKRGAKKISLHMNSKNVSGFLQAKLAHWQSVGVSVPISTANLHIESCCVDFVKEMQSYGQVHGIFVVQGCSKTSGYDQEDFLESKNNITSVVSNLSLISKNNCPYLRYFVVISRALQNFVDEYTTSLLQKICEQRAESNLPSLMFRTALLDMEPIEISTKNIKLQSFDVALNALEISLTQNYNSVLTYDLNRNTFSGFIKTISKIVGANVQEIDRNVVLKNFIFNEICFEEIKLAIKKYYSLEFSIDHLKEITVDGLLHLSNLKKKQKNKFESGLGAFYNSVEPDEYIATEVIIPMSTLSSFTEKEEELDTHGTYLILIPGFTGHHNIFKTICERLKIGAVTFQLGPSEVESSIQETAIYIKKNILKRFALKSKFYLLGYSYGMNVALEVAALLEKDGMVGTVYCLDSSPDALRIQLDAYLGDLSETQLQNTILEHFFYLMGGKTSDRLLQDIEMIENWSDKIEICINYLKKIATYTSQYQRAVIDTAYKRIIMAKNYDPHLRLESELVLLKGIPHPKAKSLPSDYNLSKYTKKPVRVYELSSDMASATEDCRVSNIVNRLLDPKLVEDFKKKNLCVTYLTAPYKVK